MTDRLIRFTTALAVLIVAGVAAVISYQHACKLMEATGPSAHVFGTALTTEFVLDAVGGAR